MSRSDPSSAEYLERAVGYKTDGNYEEALSELNALLKYSPDHPEAHHQIGLIHGFTGDFDQSLAELRRAVELDPESTLLRNDLALTYTMLGMYDEAKEQFARVLERDRENQVALRNLTYFQ
ncbi:MAG TPA: tetratricopeptide repeat protein [Capsulimonadaceae bacterium]|nr:tetratricopeptide repeat protein [Capsulimonadaceae bacterium]